MVIMRIQILCYLKSLTEAADVVFDPGRDVPASEEVQPGLNDPGGRQVLQADRPCPLRWPGARAWWTLQDPVIDVSVIPHEGRLEVIVVPVSVHPLKGLNFEKNPR